jgi:acyl dehydratase
MSLRAAVKIGDELPLFQRAAGFPEWNRYAAVNEEFVPIHMDDEAGRAAGLPGAIGMGMLQWSYLHNAVRAWLGDDGRILSMSCRFASPSFKDRTVTATGRVVEVVEREDGQEVRLEVWTQDDDGTRLAPGTCSVLVQD